MKTLLPPLFVLALAMGMIWTAVAPVAGEEQAASKSFDFVGVKKCKMCHKKDSSGAQFPKWEASKHAEAYAVLASEKAMAAAKERGIDNPQQAAECLKCHVTAFPVLDSIADQRITLEEGVSCESCHGPGSAYWKKKTMKAINAGEMDRGDVGLIKPDAETCQRCHNEDSPFYKEFDFDEFFAKIAHPLPEGKKTD